MVVLCWGFVECGVDVFFVKKKLCIEIVFHTHTLKYGTLPLYLFILYYILQPPGITVSSEGIYESC